jgi:1,4-dihydroxy-2-naphthoate octaprenyltransferase
MDEKKLWLTAIRPFSFTATIIPVLLGTSLAIKTGTFSLDLFIIVLSGVLLLHAGTNLINDYYDYQSGVDKEGHLGGSGVLTSGLLKPEQVKLSAFFCFSLAFLLALYLIYQQGLMIGILFLIGLAGGYFYTARPINYKYYALGVPGVFLLLGPILVGVSYYIQTGSYNNQVFLISLPIALLVSAILHGNDFRDIKYDSEVGIKTLANILERELAGQFYFLLVGLSYFTIVLLVLKGLLTNWALITLITIPYAKDNFSDVIEAMESSTEKVKIIESKTAKLHLKFGLLLVIALLGANFLNRS